MWKQTILVTPRKTLSRSGFVIGIVGAILATAMAPQAYASDAPVPTSPPSATSPEPSANVALPSLLSAADVARYRDIFALQARGKWAEADRQIAQLTDRSLLAEVGAQRLLSPHYRAKYDELHDWLDSYADAADAPTIYTLAMRRRPRGVPAPAMPVVGDGAPMDDGASDRISTSIGTGDEAASANHAQSAEWLAGLAAWRAGHLDKARHDFEALAKSARQSSWTIAAAAFWAARVELRTGHPELVNYWLGLAAENPRTFYGLLARRMLGIDPYIDFNAAHFGAADAQAVTDTPAGRRTLGLIEVGETQRAEAELRALAKRATPDLLQSVAALAQRANLSSLGGEIAARVSSGKAEEHDRAQFPLPHWKPRGGFQVDRALLYGLMRQESKFKPVAHNASGATGLMQLMPATARSMAARTGMSLGGRGSRTLTDPAINLALAQEYIIELMNDDRVNGNLLYFAVAYNRGPNALPKLESKSGTRADPLLFVESISNRETRFFIHQVLTNYWIYRLRLGQPTPDLDALAAGEWPIYTAQDDSAGSKILHAQN
ncbi:MAG TPA: lytic transglycosylase domain-containing protein [Stellaceae bacterium]